MSYKITPINAAIHLAPDLAAPSAGAIAGRHA
jgi:hypothetical protein